MMMRPTRRGLVALVATVFGVIGLGGMAVADPMNPTTPEDGLWYFTALGLPAIHASGITGAGVTIAIIDSPINLEVPTLQGANIVMKDSFCRDESGALVAGTSTDWDLARHGTEAVSLVVGTGAGYPGEVGVKGVAPGAKVLFYPRYHSLDSSTSGERCRDGAGADLVSADVAALSIEDAVASGAQIISMSFGGDSSDNLEAAIATALRHGVILVAALANSKDDTGLAPAANNGVVSVLSGASDGSLQLTDTGVANTSPYVDVVAPGVNMLEQGSETSKDWTRQSFSDGTSAATPIVAAELALDMQKYPDATPNQILQSMIHNTGPTGISHDATRDKTFGYGTVSARTLLLADPTEYPDVNPFIDTAITDDDPNGPSVAEIASTTTATPTPGGTPTDPGTTVGPTPPPASSSSLAPLLVVAGIVLLLIIAVIVIVVIVAARKPRKGSSHG